MFDSSICLRIISLLDLYTRQKCSSTDFDWLLSLSGLSALFTYISMNVCQLRFNCALKHRARIPKDELLYVTIMVLVVWNIRHNSNIGITILGRLFPPGAGKADVESFFKIYLGGPILFLCWLGHKLYSYWYLNVPLTKFWLTVDEIDIDTGRRQIDLETIKQEIAEEKSSWKANRGGIDYIKLF